MHGWTRSFTAASRNSAPLPCFVASHLCPATKLVWAPPVFNTCVCDLCRVRVLATLNHPRPSVVTAPMYHGCPARTLWCDPISRVSSEQSAKSCCACWCAVVRRTRRRGKSRPYVCWVPSQFPYHFFSSPRPKNVQCPCENFFAYALTFF